MFLGTTCPVCEVVQYHSYCTTSTKMTMTNGQSQCKYFNTSLAEALTDQAFYSLTNYSRPNEDVYIGKKWKKFDMVKQ